MSRHVAMIALLGFACVGDAPSDDVEVTSSVESDLTLSPGTIALMPAADAYVESGTAAGQSFGTATSVRVDKSGTNGDVQEGLLRFCVPASAGTIAKATLRVYVTNGSTNSADVFVTSNTWQESTATWNNKPAPVGSAVATFTSTTTGTWASVDVTSAVRAGIPLSLLVIPRSDDGLWFSSKESSTNQPQLVVQSASLSPPPPPPPGTMTTIKPAADAYVRSFYGDTNYGTATTVISDLAESGAGDVEWGYLRFQVGNVGTIGQAILRLYVAEGTTNGPTLWTTSSTSWSETGITWNTKPAADGVPVARVSSAGVGTWVELDVTNFVTAGSVASFAFVPNSTDGFDFDSKESANSPQLVITTAAAVAMPNPNCTLIVPDYPLTAQGLATPYQLTATNSAAGACSQIEPTQRAFVEATILDPATGKLSVYHPLVIDAGTQPAIAPVVPTLPAGAVVGIWFGYNGDTLTLRGASSSSLTQGNCVNGVGTSLMGQFAHCNGPALFAKANQLITAGTLKPPALATAKDGQPCPTSRSFSVVDQDQSDNVVTTYLITSGNRFAQNSAANRTQLGSTATVFKNGSDERLTTALDAALGCTPWTAPDLNDPGANSPALALNELMAAADQPAPAATVAVLDPFTLVDGIPNLTKLNTYRAGVDQTAYGSLDVAWQAQTDYCNNLLAIAPSRMKADASLTSAAGSPDPGAATNLYTFLAQRFNFTWEGGLNCAALTGSSSPIVLAVDANGVTTGATITLP